MRGVFVTGTDTGVGKTVVAAAVAARLALDRRVATFKPVVTGLDEPPVDGWPHDHEVLALAAGTSPEAVALRRFGPAVSPHLAAECAGERLCLEEMIAGARTSASLADAIVVEGVGGLLVPLTREHSVRDFAATLGLPVLVAARPGLGTISHTLLTLEAARTGGLRVAAVVMTPWPAVPSRIQISNRATIERISGIPVLTLPVVERPDRDLLAAAAAHLPLDRWIATTPALAA